MAAQRLSMRMLREVLRLYLARGLRPYAGKQVLRRGWRMQDKRVRPGASDYYVHDEGGRIIRHVVAPPHRALTDFLSPICEHLRLALGPEETILVAFDRAGSFPEQMAELRDDAFEFVTYERRPYELLSERAFTDEVVIRGEKLLLHESRANLGGPPRADRGLLDETANARLHATTRERPSDRLLIERPRLHRLPGRPFDTDLVTPAIVSKEARVRLDANTYSVPPKYVGQTVHVRADADTVRIVHEGAEVARHPRTWERHRAVEDPAHLQELLERRRSAQKPKQKDRFLALGPEARLYLQEVARRRISLDHELRKRSASSSCTARPSSSPASGRPSFTRPSAPATSAPTSTSTGSRKGSPSRPSPS